MMITLHGLPPSTKYQDIKILLKKECNIIDFILDNLMPDSENSKKVRVGLADESEGYRLMKCLDGFRMSGTHVLKAVPVGKLALASQQNTFDARPGFSNQQRGNYPNQLSSDYVNHGPQTHGPGHVSTDAMGRPLPWSGNDQTNQWVTNQPVGSQMQPNMNSAFGQQQALYGQRPQLQGRGPQDQNYAFPPKNPEPRFEQPRRQDSRAHVLRTVELVDAPARYPPANQPYPSQEKSMTIMKDNFQGPSQYSVIDHLSNQSQSHYQAQGQGQGQPQPWDHQGLQTKPPFEKPSYANDRRPQLDNRPDLKHSQQSMPLRTTQDYEKSGRRFSPRRGSPSGRPTSPPGRHTSASGRPVSSERHVPTSGRHVSPSGRHVSASGRPVSPSGRHIAPSGRPGSPPRPISSSSRPIPSSGRPVSPVRHIPPGRHGSPPARHISPPGRHIIASGRNFSPPSMHISTGRPNTSSGRPISPPERRVSPSGRRGSPSGRRSSPPGRRGSPPGRRGSPPGRRGSPPGRRGSPPPRRVSPSGRRTSPGRREEARRSPDNRRTDGPRRYSPHKRISPSRRVMSPPRQVMRLSPSRHHPDKTTDKYIESEIAKNSKLVRPAYEPPQAPNQAIYSGGYRPNLSENMKYSISGARQGEQRMSPWQKDREKTMYPTAIKKDDDRRDTTRMSNTRAGDRVLSEQTIETKRLHSPLRKSRSPVRRDRSPIRDRYRRHSPSPRSPRRSWALEKRRSPEVREAPPPPLWPGQTGREDFPRHSRSNFPEKDDKKHVPIWDRPAFDDKDNERRRPEDEERRPFSNKIRIRNDLAGRGATRTSDRFPPQNQRESKFSPRDEFDQDQRSDYRRQEQPERKPYPDREEKREFRDFPPRPIEDRRQEELPPRLQESPRHIEDKKSDFRNIDKDFEDIYNRAVEFRKKAEELRRSGDQRREEYSEDRGRHDEEVTKHYDQRQQFRREKSPPRHDTRSDRNEGHSRPVEYEKKRDHESEWKTEDNTSRRIILPSNIKVKRDKAVEEISNKILDRNTEFRGENRYRVAEELKLALARIIMDMFGDKDVSFIEIVIKYQARFNAKDEEKILQDVLESMPKQYRNMKRKGPEPSEVPAKSSRHSPRPNSIQNIARHSLSDAKIPDWNLNIAPPTVVNLPILGVPQIAAVMTAPPVMVPPPFTSTFQGVPQEQIYVSPPEIAANFSNDMSIEGAYSLFLCQDDFEPFTDIQAEYLKKFLVQQIIRVTETSSWAPDITLKGLQSMYRYELVTKDESSRDWLINLDFSEFGYFNVLVYTKEELWYERAAIWLPGHSRIRSIEPLEKLKLQNKKLYGVNIGKWKFVKKIVTMKGTRLYVDMPPSSARALEKHKMMLSYELQKVNVFLKALAVDKDSFDAGLKECSLSEPAELATAVQNSPMPSLNHEPGLVKITLNGSKSMSVEQARKIKEMIIYHLFKYHQQDGISKTDFVKYGFCPPSHFGIVPQNAESKRWLMARHFGKLQRQAIVVLGGDDDNVRYFRMAAFLQNEYKISSSNFAEAVITEKLKQSNQGVKGIHFNLWKPIRVECDRKKVRYEVDMDLESVETLSKMKYQLDYVGENNVTQTVIFRSEYSQTKLEEKVKKYRAEMTDSYDVANMDLDTSDSDEIVCLD